MCGAQSLIKCNDSVSYFVNQKEGEYCYIRLKGTITNTGNARVFVLNNNILQSMLVSKQNYLTEGADDIKVMAKYILSEVGYFTDVYKEKLDVNIIPVSVFKDKKTLVWYFDIPEKSQEQPKPGTSPAIRQVSISMVADNYIYSIGTTLFKDRSYDDLQKVLTDLIATAKYNTGQLDQSKLCN